VGGDNSSQSSQPVTGTSRPVSGASKDSCTVFVSNLDFSITSEQIKDIFVKVGEISEVRLVTNFSGKSKGFAYVEFRDEFPVSEALKLDRQLVCGRPMFVSPCNPSNTGHKFKFNTGLEKNKLFIKGLPFSITKEDLEQLFGTHGKLKEVRIVTYRNGKPKGLAYVDYESEVAAAQAVLRLDGHVIDDHVISVAISNPPTRSTSGLEQLQSPAMETTTFLPSLGGGKRETAEHGKARTRLALVPRSVQRPASSSAPTGSHTVDSTVTSDNSRDKSKTQPSTTNEEFRNMLLGRQ
jgi:RNA recognition motif-containing protein